MIEELAVPWDSRWKQIPEFPTHWINQYGQVFWMSRLRLNKTYYSKIGYPSIQMDGTYRGVPKLLRELHNVQP